MAALFLYRKLAKEPVEEHVLMAGPEVGATADEMKVRWLHAHLHISCKHFAKCIWFLGVSLNDVPVMTRCAVGPSISGSATTMKKSIPDVMAC